MGESSKLTIEGVNNIIEQNIGLFYGNNIGSYPQKIIVTHKNNI